MPETRTRTDSSDAVRFAIRNRIAEVIRGEDGDTDVTPVELAERIMSQFDVRDLRPYSTGGVIVGGGHRTVDVAAIAAATGHRLPV
jgi:hypothetical protein